MHNESLVRVFSARDYEGNHNDGPVPSRLRLLPARGHQKKPLLTCRCSTPGGGRGRVWPPRCSAAGSVSPCKAALVTGFVLAGAAIAVFRLVAASAVRRGLKESKHTLRMNFIRQDKQKACTESRAVRLQLVPMEAIMTLSIIMESTFRS